MIFIPLLFAVFFYAVSYGIRTLDPMQLAWLMQRDSSGHVIGWLFYLRDDWHFPLGKITNLMQPLGTSTIVTDSVPLVSFLAKLGLGWTGYNFQFFGAWLLLCYLLQAFWSFRIFSLVTRNEKFAALAACFFVLSPALLFRSDHKSMCAHWILLWIFYLYLKLAPGGRVPFYSLLAACLLSIGFHAYLLPMAFGLTLAVYLKAWSGDGSKAFLLRSGAQLAVILLAVVAEMHALGFFLVSSPTSWGFGMFSADLLGFFNSMGKSSLVPKIRSGGSQHEGFSYLGLGMIALLFAGLWAGWGKRKTGGAGPTLPGLRALVVVCGLFFFYALSSHLTFGGNTFLKIEWFYDLFGSLPHIFRSSGRFTWPLYYLVMTLVLFRVFRFFPVRMAYALLVGALVLQCLDMREWYTASDWRGPANTEESTRLASAFWESAELRGLNRMLLVPPLLRGEGVACADGGFTDVDFRALALAAAKNKMSLNSGTFARTSGEGMVAYCERFWQILEKDGVDGALLVAVEKGEHWPALLNFVKKSSRAFHCEVVDGFGVCYPQP